LVKADHLQPIVIQGFDPAEICLAILEAYGASVYEDNRVSAPVNFIVKLNQCFAELELCELLCKKSL
jgi:hypothetical protein